MNKENFTQLIGRENVGEKKPGLKIDSSLKRIHQKAENSCFHESSVLTKPLLISNHIGQTRCSQLNF